MGVYNGQLPFHQWSMLLCASTLESQNGLNPWGKMLNAILEFWIVASAFWNVVPEQEALKDVMRFGRHAVLFIKFYCL